MADREDNLWYRYRASDGSYIGTYALTAANSDARGAAHVAGEAWCLNGSDKKIYPYSATGVYRGSALSISASHSLPRALTRVKNDLWVLENSNDAIFEYDLTGPTLKHRKYRRTEHRVGHRGIMNWRLTSVAIRQVLR